MIEKLERVKVKYGLIDPQAVNPMKEKKG